MIWEVPDPMLTEMMMFQELAKSIDDDENDDVLGLARSSVDENADFSGVSQIQC